VDLLEARGHRASSRVALAQQVQIEHSSEVLRSKCEELERPKGNPESWQQTLRLIETLTKQAKQTAESTPHSEKRLPSESRKKREEVRPTEQPRLPDRRAWCRARTTADRMCPSCGGALHA